MSGLEWTPELNSEPLRIYVAEQPTWNAVNDTDGEDSDDDDDDDSPAPEDAREAKECMGTSRERFHISQQPNETLASTQDVDNQMLHDDKRFYSPEYKSDEESEYTYTSPHPLLEISSSSSSSGSTLECAQKVYLDMLPCEESSSYPTTEKMQSSRREPLTTEDQAWNVTSSINILSKPHVHMDGSRFRYIYPSPSREMVKDVHNVRFTADTTKWAMEYLSL